MEGEDEKLLEEIIKSIPSCMFPKGRPISGKLRLEEDLGIYGDDAVDFLFKFGEKYDVDLSNFDFSKYFSQENWYLSLFHKIPQNDLTIDDLISSIKRGRLE